MVVPWTFLGDRLNRGQRLMDKPRIRTLRVTVTEPVMLTYARRLD